MSTRSRRRSSRHESRSRATEQEHQRDQPEPGGRPNQDADRDGGSGKCPSLPDREPCPDEDRRERDHVERADPAADERQVVEREEADGQEREPRGSPVDRTIT